MPVGGDLISWWHKRNRFEKRLVIAVVILTVLVIGFFIYILVRASEETVCNSEDCTKAAGTIIDYVKPSIDPCDNFYDFACGSFAEKAIEKHHHSSRTLLAETVKHRINEIIKNNSLDPVDVPYSLQLQRHFYQTCAKPTGAENDQNAAFLAAIDFIGGWPLLRGSNWKDFGFDWRKIMVNCRRHGLPFNRFLKIATHQDDADGKIYLLIGPPEDLSVKNSDTIQRYVDLIADISNMLGLNARGISGEINSMLQIENELAKIAEKAKNRVTNLNEVPKITITELQARYPKIRWLEFLNEILNEVVDLKEDSLIIFASESYLRDLELLINRKDKRHIVSFVIWKILEEYIDYLSDNIRERYLHFLKYEPAERKFKKEETRSEVCLRKARNLFRNVAEVEYIRKNSDPKTIKEVASMAEGIKQQLLKKLDASQWSSDDPIKDAGAEIVKNINIIVGGTEHVFDIDQFQSDSGLITQSLFNYDLIKIINSLNKLNIDNDFRRILYNSTENALHTLNEPIVDVDVKYLKPLHTMFIPSSVLQPPLYIQNGPAYMNYGGLGTIIGQKFGLVLVNIRNSSEDTAFNVLDNDVFLKAMGYNNSCLQQEFINYTSAVDFSEPVKTKYQEILADHVGSELAYLAYQDYLKSHGGPKTLPGVVYTSKQIFWIMSVTNMCKKITHPSGESDTYTEEMFKVLGRLRNSKHFSKDFMCPVDAQMNPGNSCQIS